MDARFSDSPKKGELKKDVDFISRLRLIHLSEIFSWIAKGANQFYKCNKTIVVPSSFKIRTTELFNTEDSITTFVDRMIIHTNDKKDYIKKGDLFDKYQSFCIDNSQKCHRRSELFDRLKEKGLLMSVKDGYDIYRNVKLNLKLLVKNERAKNLMICDNDDEYKEAYELSQDELIIAKHSLIVANDEIQRQLKEIELLKQQLKALTPIVTEVTSSIIQKEIKHKAIKTMMDSDSDDSDSDSDDPDYIDEYETDEDADEEEYNNMAKLLGGN